MSQHLPGQQPQATTPAGEAASQPVPSQGESTTGAIPGAGAAATGGGATPVSYQSLTPEVRAFFDSSCAAARRAGETDGASRERQRLEGDFATERGNLQGQITTLTSRAEGAERERDAANLSLLRLRIALEEGLPNPTLNANRLIGTDEAAIREDARAFKAGIGSTLPTPPTPPATPSAPPSTPSALPAPSASSGGGSSADDTRSVEEKTQAQQSSGEYDIF